MPIDTEAEHMRFHCWLDHAIYRNLRIQAAIEGRTIRSVVERALDNYCVQARALEENEDFDPR